MAGPNALLAGYLWLKSRATRVLSIATFLAGELLKLAGTGLALYASARAMGERMVWPALVIGVIVALKGHWLAVWFTWQRMTRSVLARASAAPTAERN